jgi:hypothetical protein
LNGKTRSRTGPCPQLQVGETGIRGYLMMTTLKPAIGTVFVLPSVWSYPWLKLPRMRIFLIAACHFWSNGVNAFLFGYGPLSPTLANVYMMTGLDITGSKYPYKYKGSTRQRGVKTGVGYKMYIQNHMSHGPLS